ncbi:C4-dicarboxylate ABC transporter [Mitsuaria sp. GD03876]|uniref:SLAC1 family transporter n=1 Tax=Mitsuaria sp. GD03876 TaxID=2975399 RepID=UPI00244CC159|nr:C4-dicarboxylate ABC transporter [Mitsuaria sp. GD03876]MDH0863452.1 C4-dicarboxylate ABC transporter [Mitsuaria sp. GD03876]
MESPLSPLSATDPAPSLLLRVVHGFTPNWFALTMGTGVAALVLASLPLTGTAARLAHGAAHALWLLDAAVFALFLLLLLARLALDRRALGELLAHPQQSLFFGALPMGLVPVINGLVIFEGASSPAAIHAALGLWIADAALSVLVAVAVPYWVITRQDHRLDRVTAALLLPVVAPEVAAASAAVLAPHLPAETAQWVAGTGYVLWGLSVPLAFSILTLVLIRLILHKLPARELGVTSWLTLGPIGTGALGLLTLGEAAAHAFAGTGTGLAAATAAARDLGLVGALLLWGAGLWWLACALMFTRHYLSAGWRDGLPFNLGWWGFTFPLGVYTLATLQLARATGFGAFAWIGATLGAALLGLWALVLGRTLADLAARAAQAARPCTTSRRAAAALSGSAAPAAL